MNSMGIIHSYGDFMRKKREFEEVYSRYLDAQEALRYEMHRAGVLEDMPVDNFDIEACKLVLQKDAAGVQRGGYLLENDEVSEGVFVGDVYIPCEDGKHYLKVPFAM